MSPFSCRQKRSNPRRRENVDLMFLRFSQRFDSLDEQSQRIITALLETRCKSHGNNSVELQDQTIALTRVLNRIETANLEEHQKTRSMIIHGTTSRDTTIHLTSEIFGVPAEEEKSLRLTVQTILLESLCFPTMTTRYKEVTEAYHQTLNWIFQDTTDAQLPWDCFIDWLDRGSGVYWIKGKAGSGKSTLMRYLCDDPRTMHHLETWAEGSSLQFTKFFFWASGTAEQRSQSGLLQAVLFEVLHEQPDLIPVIFPTQWARIYSRAVKELPQMAELVWSLSELVAAFKMLVRQNSVPLKLCLFVDGLDEYDGEHEEMANMFKEVTASTNLKACLSSRPWVVFQDCFSCCPSLRLQDLTRSDIEYFTSSKLYNSDLFKRLAEKESTIAHALVFEIVEKADGVFLWVRIVVMSLLRGLRSRDGISDLQRRLLLLPRDLESLYEHMMELIDTVHQEHASQIFQIFRAAQEHRDYFGPRQSKNENLTLLALFLAITPDLRLDVVRAYDEKCISSSCDDMAAQVTARCAGLLEVPEDDSDKATRKIHYLHRTAKDFIESPKVWQRLLGYTAETNFNPNTSLLKSCIHLLSIRTFVCSLKNPVKATKSTAISAIIYGHIADSQTHNSHTELFERLDKIMTSYCKGWPGPADLHWSNKRLSTAVVQEFPSFLPFAVQFGLYEYVAEKIKKENWTFLEQTWRGTGYGMVERPLLDYAVSPLREAHPLARTKRNKTELEEEIGDELYVYPCSPKIVALLLKLGADPNQRTNWGTPWEHALRGVTRRPELEAKQSPEERWRHFQVLELLVKAGADPQAAVRAPDGKIVSALTAIETAFISHFPAEVSRLEEQLKRSCADFESSTPAEVKPRSVKLGTWIRRIRGKIR